MKRTNEKASSLQNLFITDQALESAELDEFGHNDYASLLENLVREQPTPFNIGIFGKWGVGKSTIVNLLKERLKPDLKKKAIKFLEVKVWKYDANSLRRKFIVSIAEGLGLGDELEDINKEIYFDREFETALLNFREIVSTIFNRKSYALWALAISFSLLVVFRVLNILELSTDFWRRLFEKCEEFIVIPLAISLVLWVIEIIKKAKLKIKIGKYDSEEQFENKFIELVKRDKSRKVIFIDDLDRCSKEKVVKALETIKTFLDVEGCIFIIACDDEIIKEAINRTHELYNVFGKNEGAEYLEKFFQYTVRIPPFMIPDMRKYVKTVLERNNSDLLKLGQTLEDIRFILINKNVRSPRNAITVINEFSSAYLLAKKREEDERSRLHHKIITDNLPVLAVVTSIKLHFPEFYEDLLRKGELIFWMKEILEGNKDQLNESQLEVCKKYFLELEKEVTKSSEEESTESPSDQEAFKTFETDWSQPKNEECTRLFHFLESTKDYLTNLTTKDILPFLLLGIDSTSYLIGDEDLQEFNDSLKNGIESRIQKILEAADESKREHLFEHMSYWIQEKLEGVERRKALQILSKQFHRCPESKLYELATVFYRYFYGPQIKYEDFKKFSPLGFFICSRNLDREKRQNLLALTFNFLQGIDVTHDKLVLDAIFENEDIIHNEEVIDKIRFFIDKREPVDDNTEETKEKSFVDFQYVKNKIIEFEDKSELLGKFFSGNVVDEVIANLIDIDSKVESSDNTDYQEARRIFEILKKNILNKEKKRLCESYRKLIKTSNYYSEILNDIEGNLDQIPYDSVDSLAVSLVNEIPQYKGIRNIQRTLDFSIFWLQKFEQLAKETLTSHIKDQLIELSRRENDEIFELSIKYYYKFRSFFNDEQIEVLLENFISLIEPESELKKSEHLKNVIIENKASLSAHNKQALLDKILSDLNSINGIRDENCYTYWVTMYDGLIELFDDVELDGFIMPNNPQNLLSFNFPGANHGDRSRFCYFITKSFDRFSQNKQDEYFELFRQFLSNINKENAEYSIENIYPVYSRFKNENLIKDNVGLFINLFQVDLEDSYAIKNVELIYSCRDELSAEQVEKTLQAFSTCASHDPEYSIEFLLRNWEDFDEYRKRLITLKSLLPTDLLDNSGFRNKVLKKIKADFKTLSEEKIVGLVEELETEYKINEKERRLFADIIKEINPVMTQDIKNTLRLKKIGEIKAESDIDLCRNKFSIIIAIKNRDYDKDTEINDLFFNLLHDTKAKKKLAIDVFEFYYEERHPHQRKGQLTERFNNLISELDGSYKDRIKDLARKYDLKIKKGFLESIFGT